MTSYEEFKEQLQQTKRHQLDELTCAALYVRQKYIDPNQLTPDGAPPGGISDKTGRFITIYELVEREFGADFAEAAIMATTESNKHIKPITIKELRPWQSKTLRK